MVFSRLCATIKSAMYFLGYLPYPLIIFILLAKLLTLPYSFFDLMLFVICFMIPAMDEFFQSYWQHTRTSSLHHHWIGHWPIIYLPLLAILPAHPGIAAFLALYGIVSHLILDTIVTKEGIAWLYPLSKEYYKITIQNKNNISLDRVTVNLTVIIVILTILHILHLF